MVQPLSNISSLSPKLSALKNSLLGSNTSSREEKVEAGVSLMILDENDYLETLLIQRTERHDDPWSGQIGLPGGRVKPSDGTIRSTIHREVLEEVGVDLAADGDELGALSIGHPIRRLEMRVQPWVYGLKRRPSVTIGPEVSSAFWVSLPSLPLTRTASQVSIRGEQRTVGCFLVEGKVVWGYTYRVLTELLEVLGIIARP